MAVATAPRPRRTPPCWTASTCGSTSTDRSSVRDADSQAVIELGEQPCDLAGLAGSTYDVLAGKAAVRLAAPPQRAAGPDPARARRHHPLGGGPPRRRPAPARPPHRRGDRRARRRRRPRRPRAPADPASRRRSSRAATCCCSTPTTRCSPRCPRPRTRGWSRPWSAVDDLPAGYFGVLRLAVGTDAAWVRIRRRGNDLADPHHAVLLPELYDAGPGPGRAPGCAGTPTACSRSARSTRTRPGEQGEGHLPRPVGAQAGRHRAVRDHPGQRAGRRPATTSGSSAWSRPPSSRPSRSTTGWRSTTWSTSP